MDPYQLAFNDPEFAKKLLVLVQDLNHRIGVVENGNRDPRVRVPASE